jgi:hypothetical protein
MDMERPTFRLSSLWALLLGLSLTLSGGAVFSQDEENTQIITEAQLRAVIAVQRSHETRFLAMPGVMAVGSGLTEDGRPAIHVYVHKNVLSASAAAIPRQVDNVPTIVLETDEIQAFDRAPSNDPSDAFASPVPMGVSTGNVNGTFAGTLGVRVSRIGMSDTVGYITNNHVAAAADTSLCPAQLNPAQTPAFGVEQCQPGLLDAGGACVDPPIGELVQTIPIVMGGQFENTVDAAFVSSSRTLVDKTILAIGNPSPTVQAPAVNLKVRKSGRTTGLTMGTIQTINATVNVRYGECGVAKFIGQIIITPGTFSAAGDSGALILGGTDSSGRRKPVGLLVAGSTTITVANRISDVLGALHSQIDTN